MTARQLASVASKPKTFTFGVVGTGDPRIDQQSRDRAANIVRTIAEVVAAEVRTADGRAVDVVWTPLLVDGEPQADTVGRQFREAGVDALICAGHLGIPPAHDAQSAGPPTGGHPLEHHMRQ